MSPSSGCGRPTWLSHESRLESGQVDTPWPRMSFVGDMPVASNFLNLYRPLASQWSVLDNSSTNPPGLLARGTKQSTLYVADQDEWNRFLEAGNG